MSSLAKLLGSPLSYRPNLDEDETRLRRTPPSPRIGGADLAVHEAGVKFQGSPKAGGRRNSPSPRPRHGRRSSSPRRRSPSPGRGIRPRSRSPPPPPPPRRRSPPSEGSRDRSPRRKKLTPSPPPPPPPTRKRESSKSPRKRSSPDRKRKRSRSKDRDDRKKSRDQRSLYVGNLPYDIRKDELRVLCSKYGDVYRVTLGARGFGFVLMDTRGARRAAEALDRKTFGGRILHVNDAFREGGGGL